MPVDLVELHACTARIQLKMATSLCVPLRAFGFQLRAMVNIAPGKRQKFGQNLRFRMHEFNRILLKTPQKKGSHRTRPKDLPEQDGTGARCARHDLGQGGPGDSSKSCGQKEKSIAASHVRQSPVGPSRDPDSSLSRTHVPPTFPTSSRHDHHSLRMVFFFSHIFFT